MYFYRPLKPIYAMTLDLDNTLYDNSPVINRAEIESVLFLKKYHPVLSILNYKNYNLTRQALKIMEPEIYHDVNYWRWRSLEMVLLKSGLSRSEARLGADCAMEVITYWRNIIDVPLDTHRTLLALSSKWPLIAITNGNVNLNACGLRQYFYDILRSGENGRAKPYTDMYRLAAKRLGLPCKNILHIGDDLYTDIQGAIYSGMQSCWINQYRSKYNTYTINVNQLLPNLEISELISLTNLL